MGQVLSKTGLYLEYLTKSLPEVHKVLAAVNGIPTAKLGLAAAFLLTLYCWPVWTRHRYPPGPLPLPFIGHLPWLGFGNNIAKWAHGLQDTYGEVITVDLDMHRKMVILNGPEAMYEGFVKQADALSARVPRPSFTAWLTNEKAKGLFNETDGRWQPLRRMVMEVFRQHGIGRGGMGKTIENETEFFLKVIEEQNGRPYEPAQLLNNAVNNIISAVLFGSRIDYADTKISHLQLDDFLVAQLRVQLVPLLARVPGDPIGYNHVKAMAIKGAEFIADLITERMQKTADGVKTQNDFLDTYIKKMMEEEGTENTVFTYGNLLSTCLSLYNAGTHTVANQLYWFFVFFCIYPEVQQRIRQEIDEAIGERKVSYADRHNMPYTQATITEIQRVRSVTTGPIGHYASKDVQVLGHTIPRGTLIRGNMWAVHYDEKLYPEPEKFRPERFLDSDGKYIKPNIKTHMVFGVGRRICVGEQLAREELFMFTVSTLQKFVLKTEAGEHNLNIDGVQGLIFKPRKSVKFRFIPCA